MKIQKKGRRAYAAKASALKRLLGAGMLLEGSLNMSMRGESEHWQLTDKADGKTRTLCVPARHAAEVTESIERWKQVRQAMKDLSAAAREAFANAFAGRRGAGGSARRSVASVKHASKIQYDLQGLVRLLVYGRILEPASKCATMEQNGKYLEPLVSSPNPYNVYDALTALDENAGKMFRRMNTCVKRGVGRNPSLVFYDVTNFYFEIAEADEDIRRILSALGVDMRPAIYTKGGLAALKAKVKVF